MSNEEKAIRDADVYALVRGTFPPNQKGVDELISRVSKLADLVEEARDERDAALRRTSHYSG